MYKMAHLLKKRLGLEIVYTCIYNAAFYMLLYRNSLTPIQAQAIGASTLDVDTALLLKVIYYYIDTSSPYMYGLKLVSMYDTSMLAPASIHVWAPEADTKNT